MDDSKNDKSTQALPPPNQWQSTCSQLKNAFDAWADLSRQPQALSVDERRLQEMKDLLRDLKGKIDALSMEVESQQPARDEQREI
ncbi:MAG: hypothetical protein ACK5P7_05225 [Bdellovibrio sp.]|jgi:hypothetical protein